MVGGGIANPALALAHILAGLRHRRADRGRGLLRRCDRLDDRTRAAIARVPYADADLLAETGAPAVWGEPGYTTAERILGPPDAGCERPDLGLAGRGYQDRAACRGAGQDHLPPGRRAVARAGVRC
jgi:hypothetical protein